MNSIAACRLFEIIRATGVKNFISVWSKTVAVNSTTGGAACHTPTRCLFIVHPGEGHSNHADESGCSHRNLYVDVYYLQTILEEITGQRRIPFFPDPVLFNEDIIRL
ncbi:AraC family ligand binding domain-containing protein [bacterium]|nr:AraC family ligand binding domain-containing protein [bacterium]